MQRFIWFHDNCRCIAFHSGGRWFGFGRLVTASGGTVYACTVMGLVVSITSYTNATKP